MLKLAKLGARLTFEKPANLPGWLGSTFRGGFGHHLRKTVCPQPDKKCSECQIRRECLYFLTYENPTSKRGFSQPPRPIILIPAFFEKPMKSVTSLDLKFLLLGEYTIKHLPHVVLSLQQFGKKGLGKGVRFTIERIKCEFSGKTVYDSEILYPSRMKAVDVQDFTPIEGKTLRINFHVPIHNPGPFPPSPTSLLGSIRRRLILFVNEYGSGEIPTPRVAGEVRCISKRSHRLFGFSTRSGRREFRNCWTGTADYLFSELDEVGRWLLSVGGILGAGAKSSFGLGFFSIEPITA